MSMPLVSVVIPVYNGSNYLRGAIDSAFSQTYPHCEVIVVNDGSTDDSEKICLSYGDRIRYFHKDNGGVSSALNLGLREMCGEYFSWLAHDDMFYPDKIALQMTALSDYPDKTAVVHGNYDLMNVYRNEVSHMRQEDSYSVEQLTNSVFPILMTTVHASTPLIHKSHFERIGFFNESLPLTQDYDFLFRALRGQRSVFESKSLLLSRLHGLSGKNTDMRFAQACAEQYCHFVDVLSYDEITEMFPSPRAFYLRIAAMLKARSDEEGSRLLLERLARLPEEPLGTDLTERLIEDGGHGRKLCIFGAGYHGKVLKIELEHRGFEVAFFCDNDENKVGTSIDCIPCISPTELSERKENVQIIIATDLSDSIEKQLRKLGFAAITTKKALDNYLLSCNRIIL